jgi:hypothetical protein
VVLLLFSFSFSRLIFCASFLTSIFLRDFYFTPLLRFTFSSTIRVVEDPTHASNFPHHNAVQPITPQPMPHTAVGQLCFTK